MESGTYRQRSYVVRSVVHCSQVLSAFRVSGEALPLREISNRSQLTKSMTFRLLYTLEKCGMVQKIGENLYRSNVRPLRQKRYRLGYASQGTNYGFSKEVSASLQRAADAEGLELMCVDNRYNARTAQHNADVLVRERVDLVIEFQTDETVAAAVAAKYHAANIPMIAIDIPHPGATFYGANNYVAGHIGGSHVARWLKRRWQSEADEIVFLTLRRAGSLPNMRLDGTLAGIREVLPNMNNCPVKCPDGDGCFDKSLEVMRRHLRLSHSRRLVVGAINDASVLGALRAFQEAGRGESCVAIGQNASPEGRAEIREPNTRFIGSVAYFPEQYGPQLIRLSLDLLNHSVVPPAVFTKHQLITRENVDHLYPNDGLLTVVADGSM
jgi:ribose transport system substrate-binding protein